MSAPAGPPAAAATSPLTVELTREESRLIREPGDGERLNAILNRAVSWAWREAAAKTSSLAADSTVETVKRTARGVVEGLARFGNPAATIAILEAERRTDAEYWRRESERLRAELDRVLAAAAPAPPPAPVPAGPLEVRILSLPPAPKKEATLQRDANGRVVGMTMEPAQ